MLRITVHDDPESVALQLEGRLAGDWVRELHDCWQSTLVARPGPAVRFDLREVTFVDSAGRAFLAARHVQGAELIACGCLMKAIVAEITDRQSQEEPCHDISPQL